MPKSDLSPLQRLAVVYAAELRKQMLTELFMRDMSPTQFHAEFGGGSVSRVDRHVHALAEGGWAMLVGEKSGGRRRGGVEHFYRATEQAAIDNPAWSELPYSIRAAISQEGVAEHAELIRGSLLSGTFDSRSDSHLSWTPLLLDRRGWGRVIAAVDGLFYSLLKEQTAVKRRLERSLEDSIFMTVGLLAFESAGPSQTPAIEWVGPDLVEGHASSLPYCLRLSKLMEDEICLFIVDELNQRPMSVPQFHREFGSDLGLSRHSTRARFVKLVDLAWLAKIGMIRGDRRRGPPEHLYGATKPVIFEDENWSEAPDSVKATYTWRTFDNLVKQARMAMEAGTFDARTDRHQTWSPLRVDQLGWESVLAKVNAVFHLLAKEQKAAQSRMAKSDEQPIPTIVALSAFESPQDTPKQP
jgi:hypothetical protein